MHELGLSPNRAYKKSARIVGEVLGKYHPHGDSAVYDAMVRMVQDFSLRYPLVQGQGTYGSVDGDSAAAMRYTEARLAPIAMEMLRDLEKDTVEFSMRISTSRCRNPRAPRLLPNLARQRSRRHRRGHGNQYSAAQSRLRSSTVCSR
jgi:DNA gyrase subunit A